MHNIAQDLAHGVGDLHRSSGAGRQEAAEALNEYLDLNEWQVEGIEKAIASLDDGEGISHAQVTQWVASLVRKRDSRKTKRANT